VSSRHLHGGRLKVGFVFMCSHKGQIERGFKKWANGKWFI